jgi:hypothetical protein
METGVPHFSIQHCKSDNNSFCFGGQHYKQQNLSATSLKYSEFDKPYEHISHGELKIIIIIIIIIIIFINCNWVITRWQSNNSNSNSPNARFETSV